MRAWVAALLVVLPGLAGAGGSPCPVVAEPFAALRAATQADGSAPGDAADCRAGALDLGAQADSWAFVEPAGLQGADDLDDWFTQDLVATFGDDAWVMLNVSAVTSLFYLSPQTAGLAAVPLPHQPLLLEVYPPGAEVPVARLSSCGDGVWLKYPAPGLWDFHVRQLSPAEAAPCIGQYLPGTPTDPPSLANYGIYKGCHPHCNMFGA